MTNGIIYTDYIIPSSNIFAEQLLYETVMDENEREQRKQYFERCHIKKVSVWNETDIVGEISARVEELFRALNIRPADIDMIIFCNYRYSNVADVNIPYYIKEKFGLDHATILFVDQICASSVFALGYFKPQKYGLVITVNTMLQTARIRNFTVAGDGAAFALIGNGGYKYEIVDSLNECVGKFSVAQYQNTKSSITDLQIAKIGVQFIKRIMDKNKITLQNLVQIIPQNTNLMQLEIFCKLLRLPIEMMFTDNINNGGHIGDCDTIRNLTDCASMHKKGDLILLYASGLYPSKDILFSSVLLRVI